MLEKIADMVTGWTESIRYSIEGREECCERKRIHVKIGYMLLILK